MIIIEAEYSTLSAIKKTLDLMKDQGVFVYKLFGAQSLTIAPVPGKEQEFDAWMAANTAAIRALTGDMEAKPFSVLTQK